MQHHKIATRATSLLLALIMCISLLPASAVSAEEGMENDPVSTTSEVNVEGTDKPADTEDLATPPATEDSALPVPGEDDDTLAEGEENSIVAEPELFAAAATPESAWGDPVTLELEAGYLAKGEGGEKEVTVITATGFSGGKYVDTLDGCGQGASITVDPTITSATAGYYKVSLYYAKGRNYTTGRVGFFQNDKKVGDYATKTTAAIASPEASETTFVVYLSANDVLSLRADGSTMPDYVARFDRLTIQRWSEVYEAEEGEIIVGTTGTPEAKDTSGSGFSGGSYVEGFGTYTGGVSTPNTGSGVKFAAAKILVDGNYEVSLQASRINYEVTDQIGLYVNDIRKETITLTGTNSDFTPVKNTAVSLTLKKDDLISVKVDGEQGDKGLLRMDCLFISPVVAAAPEETAAHFYDSAFRVVKNQAFTIPVLEVPNGYTVSYESGNTTVATVTQADSGVTVTPVAVGTVTITGTPASSARTTTQPFTCTVTVVERADALLLAETTYEAEIQTKIAGVGGVEPKVEAKTNLPTFFPGPAVLCKLGTAGHGAGISFTMPSETVKGHYDLGLRYSSNSNVIQSMTVYINGRKAGVVRLPYTPRETYPGATNGLWAPTVSVPVTVALKAGDTVAVKVNTADGPMNDNLWLDSVKLVPHATAVPTALAFTGQSDSLTLAVDEVTGLVTQITPIVYRDEAVTFPTADWVKWRRSASDALVWSSSNESVLTTDNGFVTAKEASDDPVTVTAASLFDSSVKATISITVGANDKLTQISKENGLTVTLDKSFPRAVKYALDGKTMQGNLTVLDSLTVNGKTCTPGVTFTADDTDLGKATYRLDLSDCEGMPKAVIVMQASITGAANNVFRLEVIGVEEQPGDENRVFTIDIPNHGLISATSTDEGAQFAGVNIRTAVTESGDTILDLNSDRNVDILAKNYIYAFLSNGALSAAVQSSSTQNNASSTEAGFFNYGTDDRLCKQTVQTGSSYTTSVWSRSWIYRLPDHTKTFQDLEDRYLSEQGENKVVSHTYKSQPEGVPPFVSIIFAPDVNGDSTVDWQDAGIAYREIMNRPYDYEKLPDMVVQRLATQQNSEGSYPFLTLIDNTRRVSLITDGLGQVIIDKFHNEGRWGDFGEYDNKLGGLNDFNEMVSTVTNDYNSYVGVHTNFTEFFAKCSYFSPENVLMKAGGINPVTKGYSGFGAYIQQCYYLDDTVDSLNGDRLNRMKLFKELVPDLGFIYSDVFSHKEWRGRRMAENYVDAELGYFVEWPYTNMEEALWSHWAVERGYATPGLVGFMSDVARFVFNGTKDRWDAGQKLDYPERSKNTCNLLMGTDTTGWEGWENTSTNDFDWAMQKVYNNNLPTKFMQHFDIMSMEHDAAGWGKRVKFEQGVEVFYQGNDPWNRVMTINGKEVYNTNAYLLPWDDGALGGADTMLANPAKLYHWNEAGGTTTWELPINWSGTCYLYQLTDLGKVNEREVQIVDGALTLTDMEKQTPYVVYPTRQVLGNEDANYGAEAFVQDPGFNYGDLRAWTLDKGTPTVERGALVDGEATTVWYGNKGEHTIADQRGYELLVREGNETQVRQTITGLIPGETYAASVTVEIQQGKTRKTSLLVDCGGVTVSRHVEQSLFRVNDVYDSKPGTYMQRMRVKFTVPAGVTTADLRLHVAAGEGVIRFDNVRVYDTLPEIKEGAPVVLYQNWEYGIRENASNKYAKYKSTYEAYEPFVIGPNLYVNKWLSNFRSQVTQRHAPYNLNAGPDASRWDPGTMYIDDAIVGERSLRIMAAPKGLAFQSLPSLVRFEEGRTYKVSFVYQYEKFEGSHFQFVVGEGRFDGADGNATTANCIKKTENLEANVGKTLSNNEALERVKNVSFTFTSDSDETWIGIMRDGFVGVTENPCPFMLDELLIEDVTAGSEVKEYTVFANVNDAKGGTLTVKAGEVQVAEGDRIAAGTVLTVTTAANSGYTLTGITVNGEALSGSTVTVSGDTTIRAVFAATTPTPNPGPPVSPEKKPETIINSDGSKTTIVTDKKTGAITETTLFADGKHLEKVTQKDGTVTQTAKDTSGKTVETLTRPDGEMSILVTAPSGKKVVEVSVPAVIPVPEKPFVDVAEDNWAKSAADFVSATNLFSGVGSNTFAGEQLMDRAMLVTVLHRLSGNVPGEGTRFSDVDNDAWYADSVVWATENNIVTGTGTGFYPSGAITRESIAVMLYRYAGLLGLDTGKTSDVLAFSDGALTSGWAENAMSWAIGTGLITGKSGGALDPTGSATRAEVAAILQRFVENVRK